ncbi:ubiquitin carboxyl-terminal hydrolase MIY1 [Monosporozyma unispora]
MDTLFNTKRVSINGYDYTILLHNKEVEQTNENSNVSCALLALCNVLLLSPGLAAMARNLITLTQNRPRVSKQDIVQVLSYMGVQQNNTIDINQLLQTLPNLCHHIDSVVDQGQQLEMLPIDPEFNGSFEDGMAMSIFRLYNVGLVHGWIINPEADPVAYEHVSRYSYENAQRVLVQSYDIKKNNVQVANGDAILQDANYLKSFLARSATQLTDYGLSHLKEIMVEKSFAVLYRNDQYYTLHKNNGELYILVVDNHYNDANDIVWKSLTSVNGHQDAFYTGSFIQASVGRTVTHATSYSMPIDNTVSNPFQDNSTAQNRTSQPVVQQSNNTPVVENEQQQLEDDELLARRLQEQEDQEYAEAVRNTYVAGGPQRRRTNQRSRQSQFGRNDEPEYEFGANDKKKSKNKLKNKLFSRKNKSKSKGKKDSDCIVM